MASTLEVEYTRPPMYRLQHNAFFCKERYSLIEASTKSGKTAGATAWIVEQALQGERGHEYWWVAPVASQAAIAYRRVKRGLDRRMYFANESKALLTLVNGARISFKTAEIPDNLFGDDVYGAVIDEASRAREESWHAVRSTLTATRGPIRIIGNVKGRKNWFYRMCRRAESGEPDMKFTRITAHDAVAAGVLDGEEIEAARRDLPEHIFNELYLAQASDDEGNPFGVVAIRKCIAPLSMAAPVAFGIDLAKSVDWSCVIGVDASGSVCRYNRFQLPWGETIKRIDHIVGNGTALVDSTGVGDVVVEELQRSNRAGKYLGYHFSQKSKQQLMEGLAIDIQQTLVRFPEGPIVNELESFEYEYTRTGVRYAAAEGLHDDCVCALALARHHQRAPKMIWGAW